MPASDRAASAPGDREDLRILIRSSAGSRAFRLPRRARVSLTISAAALLLWSAAATGMLAVEYARDRIDAAAEARIADFDRARLAEAEAARAAAERRAEAERLRAERALAALEDRHEALTGAVAEARRNEAAAAAARARLAAGEEERELLRRRADEAVAQLADTGRMLDGALAERDELADTLTRIASALDATAVARDDARAAADEMRGSLGALEAGLEAQRDSQTELLEQIEQAAAVSIGSLENLLLQSGVDVDAILDEVRRARGGAGGPFVPEPAAARAVDALGEQRVLSLMADLERVNLLRIAAARLPFANPVEGRYRLTSGFGGRRDPFNGRRAMHEGLDLAAPRGTPIRSTAAGEVIFSGWMSGYGRVIKIRHDFGFETVYAHLSRAAVTVGDRVEAGDRIGLMGSTGRSTGSHLHYEVRINGKPVDPLTFIEAARDVL